jgi:DNA polymerase-2
MNSFYGVLGSSGCRFFNPQLASSITRRGHEIIQQSAAFIEQEGYSVIYGDTDSVFVHLNDDFDEAQSESIGDNLAEKLNAFWQEQLQERFNIESCLEIEFETHYLRFLMPTIRGSEAGSKKRYAGVIRKNGDTEMVFKGLETVRSDWTLLAKTFQQELYRRIFNDLPYADYVREISEQLYAGKFDDLLTYTKRLRRPLESYVSSQPPQVKAARKMKNPGRRIQYVMTLNGPEPLEKLTAIPDYQHYQDKQLQPIADGILYFMDTSFERITQRQMDVFGQ